ncbi:hypothetical protein PWEIH_00495 [Listeria weihenstephanensis FSL R9-0317]|uniref:Excisionase n=1 Tax=Listeria weihenstephanensis TaxID=1006155 RepID=A0A1S7FSV5_9LIST|nr:hypothetical protein [Listeria weihenstephanensis]AQY50480.1 excisionase [Listeria phage LWP01] [Listeria weihenstephanensis]AQY52623.1 excisionase [Listeria phage LWP01]EUJ41497.1 hypothetical protein PWEIH_00495 [Listeria weihenstephanensis FSL R9-0317]
MSDVEVVRFFALLGFLLTVFAIFCYKVGYHDARKKMKGGGQIESIEKARHEAATSRTSTHKTIPKHILTRNGVGSK